MKKTIRKTLIAAALVGTIGIVGAQLASAHGGFGLGGYGGGYCGGYADQTKAYSEESSKAYETFLKETGDLRKEIAVKGSELNALYRQDNPDEKKVAALTGELYDLRNLIEEKAKAAGLTAGSYGHGPGMMWGHGFGGGRHMMGW